LFFYYVKQKFDGVRLALLQYTLAGVRPK